jgi:HSP20 family protein
LIWAHSDATRFSLKSLILFFSADSPKGEKKKEEEVKEKEFYRAERSYGSFARSVELPAEVRPDQINALFKDGVLEVCLPKTEEAKKTVTKIHIN